MPPKAKAPDAAHEEIVRFLCVCLKHIKDESGKPIKPNIKAVAEELSMNFYTARNRFRSYQIKYFGAAEEGGNDTGPAPAVVTTQTPATAASDKEEAGKRKRQSKDDGSENKTKKKSQPRKKGAREPEKKPVPANACEASEEENDTDNRGDGNAGSGEEVSRNSDEVESAE